MYLYKNLKTSQIYELLSFSSSSSDCPNILVTLHTGSSSLTAALSGEQLQASVTFVWNNRKGTS